MTQQQTARVTDPAVARALRQNHALLAQFLSPCSPTEAAPRLSMAPNLVHHHVRKLADLGLLFESGRQGGRVFYQLAAREFRMRSDLLPPGDGEGNGTADMRDLSAAFLHAYERSWSRMHEEEECVYGFGDREQPAAPATLSTAPAAEPYPTHLDTLTLRLTPEQYVGLVRRLMGVFEEVFAQGVREEGQPCTLAVLAFQGVPAGEAGDFRGMGRGLNSFLGGGDRR